MIALYIIAGIAAVIALLLLLRIYLHFSYNTSSDDSMCLSVSYAFVKIPIIPEKKRKIKISDFTYRKTHRKKKKKMSDEKPPASDGSKSDEKKKSGTVKALFDIRSVLFDVFARIPDKLRLDICRMRISVGGSDAAVTAVTYGAVTQAVSALLTLLNDHVKIRKDDAYSVSVVPDFLSGRLNADVSLRLSVSLGALVGLALRALFGVAKYSLKKIKG